MPALKKLLQIIYVLYAFLVFVALMLFVFVWSLLTLPFGRIESGNLIYKGCIVWADLWFFLVGIKHHNIYKEPLRKCQSYIFVSNHISYLDAAIVPKTFRRPIRPLAKVEMTRIPVFGFIYKNAVVSVDRSSAANRSRSVKILKRILSHDISVLVFPEGTFNTTGMPLKEFYDGAFRIAVETGTPIKPVIFPDNLARMHYKSIFTLNPGITRAVYLSEFSVEGLTSDDVPALKEKVFKEMFEGLSEARFV
jgi:1-acyl-sn-glycerol-3-phosphate acyltransferase